MNVSFRERITAASGYDPDEAAESIVGGESYAQLQEELPDRPRPTVPGKRA
jgi:hypothetical protein